MRTILPFLLFGLMVIARGQSIEQVEVITESNQVTIRYDLVSESPEDQYDISLFILSDGSRQEAIEATGDIGVVESGNDKFITLPITRGSVVDFRFFWFVGFYFV